MTTESHCQDCGRPLAKDCHPALEGCKKRFPGYASMCDQLTIARLRAELAEAQRLNTFANDLLNSRHMMVEIKRSRDLDSARELRAPRAPVGPFTNSQLKSRPILLETDDAALQQLRDLVNALGNWYDFAAFNDVVLASARELSEALGWVLDLSPHVGITAPGGHANCWTAQMDCGREKVYADGSTMVDALLALRAKKAGE